MLKISRVHIDYQKNPVGISEMPQFGWEIASDRRNVIQQAYTLQIAKDSEFTELVYNSGRVLSSQSAHLIAAGERLESVTKYFVRVKVSDETEETPWSETAYFVTGLTEGEVWSAPFVSAEITETDKEVSKGTYVRGTFTVKKPVKEAYAMTTALGLYQFFLNGEKVGKDEMTPGWTSYRRHLLYQTYEVTDLLKEGYNVAGAMLAAGWYKGVMGLTKARNNYGDQTGFAMELRICYEDGSEERILTDGSWKGCDSPIIFSEIYHGEIYDASLEIPGWASNEISEGNWHQTAEVPFDTGVIRAQSGARVQVIDEIPAKRLFTTPKGEQVLDFGQNMAGRIRVTATGKPGDVIWLKCFEVLDSKGNVYLDNLRAARAEMKYTFAKEGTITWYPRFTYMGFQYAQILSCPGEIKAENFTACTMHSEMEPTGNITCSNPLLNQLHHNYLWGLKSNFLYLMYGDTKILEIQYNSMRGWIEFMREHSNDYIWNYKLQFGDWVALDAEEGSYFGATPNDLTCTAYFAYSTGLFAKIARVLNKEEAADYEDLYAHIVKKFQETFFDAEGNITAQTQTAHIVALYFGLTPKAYREKTVKRLTELLEKENGHLVTGFVGTPYFCHALSQNGRVKEAYDLLLKEDFPSWLYQVKQGATTIWEHWDGLKPDGTMWSADMNSFNHYAYGAIGEWMYRVMGGIEADEDAPGFQHVIYAPKIGGNLKFVDTTYHSVYGENRLKWQVEKECVTMSVRVPANTTAGIRLDGAKEVLDADGLVFEKKEGYMGAEAGSGEYTIRYKR